MPKKPRIPHLLQPKKSVLCVPTCARMATLAFGHDYSVNELAKMIDKGYVAMVAVRPKILIKSQRNGFRGGHSLIVRRIDFKKNRVYVIDPGNNVKKQESYTIDHFETARNFHDHVIFVRGK